MDLIIGIIIGTLYGRNMEKINQQTAEDLVRMFKAFSRTQFAATMYYMVEGVYLYFERKFMNKHIHYNHDMLCTCNRRSCRPVNINTYARKMKAFK